MANSKSLSGVSSMPKLVLSLCPELCKLQLEELMERSRLSLERLTQPIEFPSEYTGISSFDTRTYHYSPIARGCKHFSVGSRRYGHIGSN